MKIFIFALLVLFAGNAFSASAPGNVTVALIEGDYVVSWTTDQQPGGGFDIWVDENDPGTWRTKNTFQTISGLDTSVRHCFRVEARYTDLKPQQFLPSPAPGACLDPVVVVPDPVPDPTPVPDPAPAPETVFNNCRLDDTLIVDGATVTISRIICDLK